METNERLSAIARDLVQEGKIHCESCFVNSLGVVRDFGSWDPAALITLLRLDEHVDSKISDAVWEAEAGDDL